MRCAVVLLAIVLGCGDNRARVDDDAGADAATSAELAVSTSSGEPATTVNAMPTEVGATSTFTLSVTNTGTDAALPLAITISGSSDFSVDPESTCPGAVLAAGASCTVVVAFAPSGAGNRTATLRIASGAQVATVELAGTGFVPAVHFDPPALAIGHAELDMTTTATIDFVNDAPGPATITNVAITGAEYSIAGNACSGVLGAGARCTITIAVAPSAVAPRAATLSITADGETYDAAITAHGARRITLNISFATAVGPGRVVSTPPGIDCTQGECSALFTTDVIFTAMPGQDMIFRDWQTNPSFCRTASTCTWTLESAALYPTSSFVRATFEYAPNALKIQFAGNVAAGWRSPGDGVTVIGGGPGPGGEALYRGCSEDCSLALTPGYRTQIMATTLHDYGGMSGACTPLAGNAECELTAGTGVVTQTVTLTKDPKEAWTLVLTNDHVISVQHDPAGNILVASTGFDDVDVVRKLSPAGEVIWQKTVQQLLGSTAPNIHSLRVSPDGRIHLAVSIARFVTLDPNGTVAGDTQWFTETPFIRCGSTQCLAVTDDAFVIHGAQGTRRQSATSTWIRTSLPRPGIAIDASGVVWAGVDEGGTFTYARRYTAAGVEVPPLVNVCPQPMAALAFDSDANLLTTCSGRGTAYLQRTSPTGTLLDTKSFVYSANTTDDIGVPTTVATTAGRFAWIHQTTKTNVSKHRISIFANAGTLQWSLDRSQFLIPSRTKMGVSPVEASFGPNGHLVVGGRYTTAAFGEHGYVTSIAP